MKTPDRLSRSTETMARAGREAALFARRASARYADHASASLAHARHPGTEAFTARLAARRHRLAHLGALTASNRAAASLASVLLTRPSVLAGRAASADAGRTRTPRAAVAAGPSLLTRESAHSLLTHMPLAGAISSALPSALQFALGLSAATRQSRRPGDIPALTRLTLDSRGQSAGGPPPVRAITQISPGWPLAAAGRHPAAVEPLTPAMRTPEEGPDRLFFRQTPDANMRRGAAPDFRPAVPGPDRAEAPGTPERTDRPRGYIGLGPSLLRDTLVREGGSGSSLDHALRTKLSPHLHFDLGMARLHRGVAAGAAARELKAQAFTIGRDVFFGEARYDPDSREGLGLLAHELTHVGQQTRGVREGMHFFTPSGGGALEEEARQTAGQVLAQSAPPQEAPNAISQAVSARTAPAMTYAMRAISSAETHSAHSTAAAHQASSAPGQMAASQKPDPHVVSDRVYDLMKKELARDRQRGVFAP